MSDVASKTTNALNVQQLFASLTGAGSSAASTTDPDLFGQNLPTDPDESTKAPASSKSGGPSGATNANLADQARSKRDAALAQSRLDLLGLQEQSGKSKGGAHGTHGHGKPFAASEATKTASSSASSAALAGAGQTGITGAAANDEGANGLSTLLLAQLAAA